MRWFRFGSGLLGVALPLALLSAQSPAPEPLRVVFVLKDRSGQAVPVRSGLAAVTG